MKKKTSRHRGEDYYRQRRTRRLSVLLILGVAALLAAAAWLASAWYSGHVNGGNRVKALPPLPALDQSAPATK